MNLRISSAASRRTRAFTLMEVMIAVGILFICLFAVLALTSNSLRAARLLQQHRGVDTGTVAGMIYVQLTNTNQIKEGCVDFDLDEIYEGYKCEYCVTERETNKLCQIDFLVTRPGQQLELQSHFLMYCPNLQSSGIGSGSLPQH